MRVKTFQGRTLEEVLPDIRAELGPAAVVLGQRQVVNGGVGGFFGKRMIEVTAADRMPSDTELVDLEDRVMGREANAAPAMAAAGARPRIDVVDDWDPSQDDQLAGQYGTLSRHANVARENASAASRQPQQPSYEPLDLPRRDATVHAAMSAYEAPRSSAPAEAAAHPDPVYVPSNMPDPPELQARRLAARAHEAIAAATREIEQQLTGSHGRTINVNEPARVHMTQPTTFRAEVSDLGSAGVRSPIAQMRDIGNAVAAVDLQPTAEPQSAPREHVSNDLHKYLFSSGVDSDVADSIVQKIAAHRQPFSAPCDVRDLVRDLVTETIRTETGWPAIGRTHRIALVGASGAGTSSVVAKLAEGYAETGMHVGVISVIAGATSKAQLAAHAGDPLVRRGTADIQFAADPTQMITAMERFSDRDLVLIDTPSSAYLEPSVFAALASCLSAVRIDDVQVVVPLAMSVREAESVIEHYRPLGTQHIVVTKLDESRYAGQLLNFGFRFGLPITFLTDGPRIPEDIRAASAREIATLIVPEHEQGMAPR